MRLRSSVMILAAVLAAGQALWALEISEGKVKLTLSESSGRFSFSYLTDQKKNTYTPFLLEKDPRTSFLAIALGNKVYRMGESSEFRQSTERSDKGARFIWSSSLITVIEEFTFVTSAGSTAADWIRIDLSIKNATDKTVSVGARYLFDTYLGEASYIHFRTDKILEINRELTLTKADTPRYWVSPLGGDKDEFGLMCMLSGDGVTAPDRVVFANWKRLSDASWGYETSATRNFNLMPYSVNDSAVSMYWDPRDIEKGQELRIVSLMGRYNPGGFSAGESLAASTAPQAAAGISGAATAPGSVQSGGTTKPSIKLTDLDALNALISRMDQRISSGEPITDEELARFVQALADLKARAGESGTTGK